MMNEQVTNQIERTRKILALLYNQFSDIQKVILFGSRARGDEEERSDIDVAIDADHMDLAKWNEICLFKDEHLDTLLSVDLIWIQHAPVGLKQRIAKEGVLLFERKIEAKHD